MILPHKLSILIIEDNDLLRQSLAEMLDLNGFRVIVANCGNDGLHLAKRDNPALIITDVNMPGMNGLELLEIFRRDEVLRSIPVIVISARVDRVAMRRSMELGATDFITKPFTEDELLLSITTRLENKALLDELEAFAHTVAHDLKNPLATVAYRLEMLDLMLDNVDKATIRHQLAETLKSSRRLSGIIDEILLLAGVRRQGVVPHPLDMAAVVAESINRLESILKEQSVRIEKPDVWPTAVGHAPWVIQVWVNYISNAAKYGGRAPLIKLGAQTSANERHIQFWVQDSGPGLDEEAQTRLFVPFTRISAARVRGHGLGLSIVRRIVEKLGGNVGVTSRPGAGARFWFELPVGSPKSS